MPRHLKMSVVLVVVCSCGYAEDISRDEAANALKSAVRFFTAEVATEGGYLWRYSKDLDNREGEGIADDATVWVQPPGTPSVGIALLAAYHATGDTEYLRAAIETGHCLVRGQLRSGGWDYRIVFDPKARARYAYRVDQPMIGKSQRNTTTLDDNTTQSAIRFLMRLDKTLEFEDAEIHEAVVFALDSVLAAQYPNGAWPQRYDGPFQDRGTRPALKASYPDSWSREFPKQDYRGFYTLNDNAQNDVITLTLEAGRIYHEEKYRAAALRGGDFLLAAQMPDPQPGWAQQYDQDMHPAWARKFEPPSITGWESQRTMQTLLMLYRETGKKRFLQPIPRAVSYYRKSLLDDGRLARFYELKSNRPLYLTKDYVLTYSDADMPAHYAFKVGSSLDRIERDYKKLATEGPGAPQSPWPRFANEASLALTDRAARVVRWLDGQGRWVEDGRLKYHGDDDPTRRIISSQTFVANVTVLAEYLFATRSE
jgi:PelA/Pel-15E family pectate lyase